MNSRDYKSPWGVEDSIHYGLRNDFKLSSSDSSKPVYSSGGCVKHSADIQFALEVFFSKLSRPFHLVTMIPFGEPLRSEIKRFLISLEAYLESSEPKLSQEEIMKGVCLGPSYAEYLKRVRLKSFIKTNKGIFFGKPDWWDEIPEYQINDIGEIFNYAYLIHWEEECEDYLYGFEPVSISPEYIEFFEETLRILLRDTPVERIDPREILLSSSGSITLNENFKKMKIFEVKERMNGFSESRHPVKRCVIQVGPQNTRDTVINQLNDLNKIKLIEFQTMKILEELENFIVNKNLEDFEIKYSKFKKNHKWFLCRDFTKEGITKPRELLRSILKVFNELYPDMEAYQEIDFFNSFELIVDNEMKRPLRGHGLGMANSLTTLMQIIIFTMTKLKMEINTDAITLLTHNDDAIIGT